MSRASFRVARTGSTCNTVNCGVPEQFFGRAYGLHVALLRFAGFDYRADTLMATDEPEALQTPQRLAHGVATDAKLGDEFQFARHGSAHRQLARTNGLQQGFRYLLITLAATRRRRLHPFRLAYGHGHSPPVDCLRQRA